MEFLQYSDSFVDAYLDSIENIKGSEYIMYSRKTDNFTKYFDLHLPVLTCFIADIYLTPAFLSCVKDTYGVNTFVLTERIPETTITDTSDRPSAITGVTFDTKNSIFIRGPLRNTLAIKKCNFYGESQSIDKYWELAGLDLTNTFEFDQCNFKNMRISINKSTMRKVRYAFVGCKFDNCTLIFDCHNVKNLTWANFLDTCMNEAEQTSTSIADVLSMITFNDSVIDSASTYNNCVFMVHDCRLSEYNWWCRVTIGKKLPVPGKYLITEVALKDGYMNIEKSFE